MPQFNLFVVIPILTMLRSLYFPIISALHSIYLCNIRKRRAGRKRDIVGDEERLKMLYHFSAVALLFCCVMCCVIDWGRLLHRGALWDSSPLESKTQSNTPLNSDHSPHETSGTFSKEIWSETHLHKVFYLSPLTLSLSPSFLQLQNAKWDMLNTPTPFLILFLPPFLCVVGRQLQEL